MPSIWNIFRGSVQQHQQLQERESTGHQTVLKLLLSSIVEAVLNGTLRASSSLIFTREDNNNNSHLYGVFFHKRVLFRKILNAAFISLLPKVARKMTLRSIGLSASSGVFTKF